MEFVGRRSREARGGRGSRETGRRRGLGVVRRVEGRGGWPEGPTGGATVRRQGARLGQASEEIGVVASMGGRRSQVREKKMLGRRGNKRRKEKEKKKRKGREKGEGEKGKERRWKGTPVKNRKAGRVAAKTQGVRSEERRVGKECRIGCRSRWSPYH